MSLLKQLTSGQKTSAVAAVKESQNVAKAEARQAESRESETSQVSTKTSSIESSAPVQKSSLLGTLGSKSVANETRAGDSVLKKTTSLVTTVRENAEKAKADHDFLFAPIPTDFQEVLNGFDEVMQREQGLIDFQLDRARDFVKKIMVDLKENPEYDGLIIDRDVRNIIAFQRRLKAMAQETVGIKIEKAAKKAAKPKAGSRFAMDFDNLDLGAQPKSLSDLSETNTDDPLGLGDIDL